MNSIDSAYHMRSRDEFSNGTGQHEISRNARVTGRNRNEPARPTMRVAMAGAAIRTAFSVGILSSRAIRRAVSSSAFATRYARGTYRAGLRHWPGAGYNQSDAFRK